MNNEYTQIIKTLKRILKERKVTYMALAKKLGVSEVTVKRIFSSSDGSFSKLSDICFILDISLFDLIEEANPKTTDVFIPSNAQMKFFDNNFKEFIIYSLISEGVKTSSELMKLLNIDSKKLFLYLKKLDDQELIILGQSNRFKIVNKGILELPNGKLSQRVHERIVSEMSKQMSRQKQKNSFNRVSVLKLTERQLVALKNDFNLIYSDILLKADKNLKIDSEKNLKTVTMSSYIDNWDPLRAIATEIVF